MYVVPSPQTLTEADRRIVAAWAADCAEHVVWIFEAEVADDDRPREAIARARAFARGELSTSEGIATRFVGLAAARGVGVAAAAAARAAGHAAAVPHMGAHALGAAACAVKAVDLHDPGNPEAARDEIEWQLAQLSDAARAGLRRLPPLGENRSGPLGPGLLTQGVLAVAVRELQSRLATSGPEHTDGR